MHADADGDDATAGADETEPDEAGVDGSLETRLERFVLRNFPQIQLHGGDAGVEAVDRETGEVWLSLTGACSGCGISPMTIQALRSRMIAEFDEVTDVHARAGAGDADPRSPPSAAKIPSHTSS